MNPFALVLRSNSVKHFVISALALVGVAHLGGCATSGRTFDSPEAASTALIEAIAPINDAKIKDVLGSQGVELLRSPDMQDDQEIMDRFVAAYRRQHELVGMDDDTVVIEVGEDGWPMPIPIVRSGNGWRFDTAAGAEEITSRRVGRNELSAIQTCQAIVDAEREYAAAGFGGMPGVYAARFVSQTGTRNGLYWPVAPNEAPSPLGPHLADATPEQLEAAASARGSGDTSRPYHGYVFRILRSQGSFAPGGARDYMENGHLAKGFAIVAWPAEYGTTGVMTFITSHDGIVFERDFGSSTRSKASAIRSFDPTPEWTIVTYDGE